MVRRLLPLLALPLLAALAAAENLYPDPGFEASGRAGDAHSGQKAGYLSIGAKEHWLTTGGRFAVEPFATYRATAFAKARVREGAALALYVYQWDSYVWAFGAQANLSSGADWQPVSVTFRAPQDHVYLHPLAFMDAAEGEAWIDDIVVERVKSADETMAELAAKAAPSGDEARLLARWHLAHRRPAEAEALLARDLPAGVKADIACVLAKAAAEPERRARFLAEMVRHGAASLNDGPKRMSEVAQGLPVTAMAEAVRVLAEREPNNVAAARALAAFVRELDRGDGLPCTLAEQRDRCRAAATQAAALLAVAPADSPLRTEFEAARADLAARQARVESEMRQRGHATVTIAGKAVSPETFVIAVPDNPTPQEALAARDLQAHLERITGGVVPITGTGGSRGKRAIVVGRSPLVDSLGVRVDYDKLGDEGVRLATAHGSLVLTGNRRGVLYAVYSFLEDQLGCRWFTADCATWPTEGTLAVPELNVTHVPPLEYRATDYPNSRPAEFAVRNRLNGAQVNAGDPWGGKISYQGFVHTFNALVPPEQHFDAHPEYFSEIDGKRQREYTQLCLTNPDVLRLATETVRRWIAEAPEATIVSVSQNDWHNPCQCAKCQAVVDAEGSQSGPLLHFVNAIAAAIEPEHPDIIIDTLAYQYTRKPPRHVRPRDNVAVRLCSIECEFNRPLTSPFNASFVDDIRGWNAICDRLHIWDYVINYAHCVMPFPNLNVLQPNIQFFIANGVTGIYEEANYFSKGGELAELRTWLMAKLLWNPDYDLQRGIDEFLAAYYGPAAPPIRRYLDDMHRLAVSDPNYHMRIYVGPQGPFQTPEALARYDLLFSEAEDLVRDDPVRLHRVQVARLPIYYTHIAQRSAPVYRLTDTALVPGSGDDISYKVRRFAEIARAEGVTRISEGQNGELEAWLGRVGPGPREVPLVKLEGGGLTALVAPAIGGRILSLRRGEQELLQVREVPGGIDPTTGGYKEFSESGYQSPGWAEAYEVVDQSATAIILRSPRLSNGLAFERRYELPGDGVLRVTSTLTNRGDAPRKGCVRVHACFRLQDAAQAALRWNGQERSLAAGAAKETELYLRDADRPAGSWTVVDPAAGVTIESRFKPEQVGTVYFNWNGPDQRANPELWGVERMLGVGESVTMEHEYRVGRQ